MLSKPHGDAELRPMSSLERLEFVRAKQPIKRGLLSQSFAQKYKRDSGGFAEPVLS